MPRLLIKLTKRTDGGYVIACTRPDGSVTWQRGGSAAFFPVHDLTHFAVETELRHRHGFFGLLADGWDFTDFGAPWPRGRIPADAEPAELIVGLLDSERAAGPGDAPMSAREFNGAAARYDEQQGVTTVPAVQVVALSDAQLARIRARVEQLEARWAAVPPGAAMELTFDVE